MNSYLCSCNRRKKQAKREKEKERGQDPDINGRQFYFRNKYKTDAQFKLKKQFESKLNQLLRDNDTTEVSQGIIGCTIPEFKAHLEANWHRECLLVVQLWIRVEP